MTSVAAAEQIRNELKRKVEQARMEREPARQKSLLSVAVVGGGITGMEASAEIAYWLNREAEKGGLGPEDGLFWMRQWGMDLILTGKAGLFVRNATWDSASLIGGDLRHKLADLHTAKAEI